MGWIVKVVSRESVELQWPDRDRLQPPKIIFIVKHCLIMETTSNSGYV